MPTGYFDRGIWLAADQQVRLRADGELQAGG
jgi:hypothetical protein